MSVKVFDLRDEPCELAPGRWTRHTRRDQAGLRGVVLHSWGSKVGTESRLRRRHGPALALARRAMRAPYTVSAGVALDGTPVVAIAHPLERYTFASDAGNRHFLAVGVMGLFPFTEAERNAHRHSTMTDALAEAVAAALAAACDLLAKAGAGDGDGPWPLITHRQCINDRGDHIACPGETVIAAALRSKPVADGLFVADPDMVIVPEFGKPWPDAWRRHMPAPRQTALCLDDAAASDA